MMKTQDIAQAQSHRQGQHQHARNTLHRHRNLYAILQLPHAFLGVVLCALSSVSSARKSVHPPGNASRSELNLFSCSSSIQHVQISQQENKRDAKALHSYRHGIGKVAAVVMDQIVVAPIEK
jgi:hypothetical protein